MSRQTSLPYPSGLSNWISGRSSRYPQSAGLPRWIAWVGVLASGVAAVVVQSVGYLRLERDQAPTPQDADDAGDTEQQPLRL